MGFNSGFKGLNIIPVILIQSYLLDLAHRLYIFNSITLRFGSRFYFHLQARSTKPVEHLSSSNCQWL